MTIHNIAYILTGLIEAVLMLMLCETFFTRRDNLPLWVYGVSIAVVAAVINVSNVVFNYGMLNIAVMILAFFAMSFLYKGKVVVKAIISVLHYLMLLITEVLILFIITIVFNLTTAEVVEIPSYQLLGIVASKMLAFLLVNFIRYKYRGNRYMNTSYWILFFLMFSSSVVTMFLVCKLTYDIDGGYIYNLSALCSFGLLFSTIFALYLYEHITKQAEKIREQEQYEQQLRTQLKHVDDILITQKQIKSFKHDFNNFRIGLAAYIKDKDFRGADNYINELAEKFNHEHNIVETGNTAFDAILSTKIAIAESKGITVNKKIQIPEDICINPVDLCVIFGNALDNAIEACERADIEDKEINITIICKDEAVFCKIVNTASKSTGMLLDTSKADKQNHGFGLENITMTLSKYNASPTIERTNTEFVLKFVIFIKE